MQNWQIYKDALPSSRQYMVMRKKVKPTAYEKFDTLKGEDGKDFKTEADALAAIAKAEMEGR